MSSIDAIWEKGTWRGDPSRFVSCLSFPSFPSLPFAPLLLLFCGWPHACCAILIIYHMGLSTAFFGHYQSISIVLLDKNLDDRLWLMSQVLSTICTSNVPPQHGKKRDVGPEDSTLIDAQTTARTRRKRHSQPRPGLPTTVGFRTQPIS